MRCPGLHCDGCRGGGGGAALLALVLAVIIAAARRPIEHAARVGLDVLEVATIALGAILGLAVLGAVAYVALRARSRHVRTRQEVSWHTPRTLDGSQAATGPPAIEARRRVVDGIVIRDETRERRQR